MNNETMNNDEDGSPASTAKTHIRATHTFPRGFKWGTATAARQVEGGSTPSDWSAWEKLPGKIREGGAAGIACDWWGGRWREDFDRAANDGQATHRLGVDWSRIEPRLAVWDEEALDHYRQMIQGLRERGLEPMVTLHHFVNPLWLAEKGGWENPAVVTHFERFVRKVVGALKEDVDLWCTINEPNVAAYQAYADGIWPPEKKDGTLCFRAMRHMLLAHAAAYHAIHELQPQARVGLAHHIELIDPWRPDFAPDRWVAAFQNRIFNEVVPQAVHTGRIMFPVGSGLRSEHVPGLAGTMDYVGVNYYSRRRSMFDPSRPGSLFGRTFHTPGAEVDHIDQNELYPEGLFRVLKWANEFGKPIFVTENGWGDVDEERRARALMMHLRQLWRAVNFNWPVQGYYYWTLVDNFEWERGWTQPFGLYALDIATQTRTPRPVAKLYAEVCKTNTISSDMAARYTPELLPTMFPG
ncbi:MAG TPA: family 1 glycosylhydrolase [Anaerolineales bacterium]|nr:family 1 glycosylhydrolase [Anaerolineales bacterium]